MNRPLRWAAAAALATSLGVGVLPAPAGAADRSATLADHAVVELTREGARRGASELVVHHVGATRVFARNTAVASAACDGCRAVALSFQVVLADRAPADVDASNIGVAVNEGCRRCVSLAVAYQVVVVSPGRTRLSEVGRTRLHHVRTRLRDLARADKPLPHIRREADRLMRIVQDVVTEELRSRPVVRQRERWDDD